MLAGRPAPQLATHSEVLAGCGHTLAWHLLACRGRLSIPHGTGGGGDGASACSRGVRPSRSGFEAAALDSGLPPCQFAAQALGELSVLTEAKLHRLAALELR